MTQLQRPNGTSQSRQYDAAGQLTQLTDYAPDGATVIYSQIIGFDAAGQLTGENVTPASAPSGYGPG
jgi:YD repeat-containing protein